MQERIDWEEVERRMVADLFDGLGEPYWEVNDECICLSPEEWRELWREVRDERNSQEGSGQ